jgi:hypothetical protein
MLMLKLLLTQNSACELPFARFPHHFLTIPSAIFSPLLI